MLKERHLSDGEFDTGSEIAISKRLPCNLEAERAVLGALLLNDNNLGLVAEILSPEDFYSSAHQITYQAILDLVRQLKRIDLVTLQDELIKRGQLEAVGGIIFLLSLQEDIPAVGLIEQHATIIKEKAVLRRLIQSASSIITNCYTQNNKNIDAVLDNAEKTIFQISNKRTSQSFVQLNIWLKKTFRAIIKYMKGHGKGITGVPSGYAKLDEMTSGFQNGDFIVLAARPSMGKTALASEHSSSCSSRGD